MRRVVGVGATTFAPEWTVRTAEVIASAGALLSRKPLAPAPSPWRRSSSVSMVVNRMTRVGGELRSTSLVISTPSMFSMWTSVMRTSTWWDWTNLRASWVERVARRTERSSTPEK